MNLIRLDHRTEAVEELQDLIAALASGVLTYEDLAQRLDVLIRCVEVWTPFDDIENDYQQRDYSEHQQASEGNGVQGCLRQTHKHNQSNLLR